MHIDRTVGFADWPQTEVVGPTDHHPIEPVHDGLRILPDFEASAAHLSSDQRRNRTRQSLARFEDRRGQAQSDDDRLGQLLLSGASQQSLQCGRYACPLEAASVVMRQTQRAAAGIQTFSGGVPELCVWLGPVATPDREPSVGESVSLFREPDAGKLPVRFDEREQETGPSQTGLRWRGESHVEYPPGDYSYCACSRLYSPFDSSTGQCSFACG